MTRSILLSLLLAAGCGGITNTERKATGIHVVSGAAIADTVDARLAQPLVIEVKDSTGAPAAGMSVDVYSIAVNSYPTVLFAPSAGSTYGLGVTPTTGADGRVSVALRLGAVAGAGGVIIHVPAIARFDTIPFTTRPGNAALITIQPRDTTVGPNLAYDLNAFVADRHGNAVAPQPLTYAAGSGIASVSTSGRVITGASLARAAVVVHSPTLTDTARVSVVPPLPLIGVRTAGLQGIMLLNADGSGERQVLIQNDMSSPRMVAASSTVVSFHGEPASFANIYITSSVDGSNTLFPGFGYAVFPALSRDAQWVYFVGIRAGSTRSLWRFRLGTTAADSLLALNPDWYDAAPAVSPDGQLVAVGQCCTTKMLRVATGEVSTIGQPCDRGAFSPDGAQLACLSRHSLFVMNPDGNGYRAIAVNLTDGYAPEWSADGKWIITQRIDMPLLVSVADGTEVPLTNLAKKYIHLTFVR